MDDYYRARFNKLIPGARPRSDGPGVAPMPKPLRCIYVASCALATLGWFGALGMGRGWLVAPVLLFPISVALMLGFSEGQRWTRPLMPSLLLLLSLGLALAESWWAATACLVLAVCAAWYLYAFEAVNHYYAYLRKGALVRISASDLYSVEMLPVYTMIAGAAFGAWLGFYAVTLYLGMSSDLGINDLVGAVSAGVFLGSLFGFVGRLVGEAISYRPDCAD